VELTYRITEGPQVHVKEVLYSGMEYTRTGTIRNQVLVKPGEPLRQGEIIESQRNLYNLGIFNRVQIAPQNPAGTDTEKTLLVNVEEAKRYTIAYGGGFEIQRQGGTSSDPTGSDYRVSPRGLIELSKLNVGGRGHTVSLRARASTFQYRFAASYLAPNFLARPSLRFEVGGFAEKESDVRTFTALRYEASAQLVHQVTPFTTMGYRYSFRKVLVDADTLKVDPAQIPLLSQPTKISSFGTAWIRDHRDSPAEARGGTFYSLDVSAAAEKIGATGNFMRLFAQNSTFHPIRALTFARTTRFGVLQRFAGSLATDIPLPERIYGGGGNSLRGFGFNQAGPRASTGFPIGGELMMIFNQELRFPMKLPFVKGRVGGGIFYDAGNVFNDTGSVTLRAKPQAQALGLGDFFSHTIGVSFRYSTPIGPVRLDFGYLLNNIQFNFQENSTSPVQTARLPRFQFFFNIGSMF
jgi:outer membrane protein assembly factor BamA